ncbi:hypothetical protein [Plantactinospora sp. GCM10030261]|uniref:hypothetical protein n=1 Tax=Plantactinospora sp. GCM10030261 TaxID=3273420 RepID=UPI0036191A05
MSTQVPRLFDRLIDDAAVFPPGNAPLTEAVAGHRRHRAAAYADLVGPLLLPASALGHIPALLATGERLAVGMIGDVPLEKLASVRDQTDPRLEIRQVEAAVAKRGEDPGPGLAELVGLARRWPDLDVYAEVPLTWGLLTALDEIARERAAGVRLAAKFRTGGLAAELFPTPVELAAVICACRDRQLPFKLTAGLHHALRHTDPETGFTHHGFVNVLAATAAADDGAEVAAVAELLAATDPLRVVDPTRVRRDRNRPLWIGFGSCSVAEPVEDLVRLGLMHEGTASSIDERERGRG